MSRCRSGVAWKSSLVRRLGGDLVNMWPLAALPTCPE
eukprot:CAMPEP_0181274778 /NCGR_PEP_ID=MMETSP1097-20121128/9459_1 /TAXON_ID=35684 /ORGANISM="Pseudopedinella elastica, Strain CCMP716" /LENGTH=36 /DNA_ID= /DNA_START= /DNA_END= /DNA_ORIENTATION=